MAPAKSATTVMSTKGQVILPKAIREAKNSSAGVRLVAEATPQGVLLRPERPFPPTRPEDVFGSLSSNGKHLAIEDFDKVISDAVKRRYADD